MPGLRWSELEDPIRVSSLLGIVSGGSGIIALGFLAIQEAYYVQIVLASLLPLLLIPLLTGLSLLFLKLTNEQRGVMGLSASLARCLSWLPITSFSSLHIALQFTQLVHEA